MHPADQRIRQADAFLPLHPRKPRHQTHEEWGFNAFTPMLTFRKSTAFRALTAGHHSCVRCRQGCPGNRSTRNAVRGGMNIKKPHRFTNTRRTGRSYFRSAVKFRANWRLSATQMRRSPWRLPGSALSRHSVERTVRTAPDRRLEFSCVVFARKPRPAVGQRGAGVRYA